MTTEDEKELPPAAPSSEVTEGIEKNELDKPEEEILEIIADEENGPPDWQKKITKTIFYARSYSACAKIIS